MLFLFSNLALATPILNDEAIYAAQNILKVDDDRDPVGRVIIALAALERDLNEDGLFAMATTHPHIAEMLYSKEQRFALNYIQTLPSSKRNQLRRGSTIIRFPKEMSGKERLASIAVAEHYNLKPQKMDSMRVGMISATEVMVEIIVEDRRLGQIKKQIFLGRPSTPIEDEKSREKLTKIFNSRPSPPNTGMFSVLDVKSPSFESASSLEIEWGTTIATTLGAEYPVGTVELAQETCLDGKQCLRFYSTDKTRAFKAVEQWVSLEQETDIEAIVFIRAEQLRTEHQQVATGASMSLHFFDGDGNPLSTPQAQTARLGSYSWEPLLIKTSVPTGAAAVKISLTCALSGTLWMDGFQIRRNQ